MRLNTQTAVGVVSVRVLCLMALLSGHIGRDMCKAIDRGRNVSSTGNKQQKLAWGKNPNHLVKHRDRDYLK